MTKYYPQKCLGNIQAPIYYMVPVDHKIATVVLGFILVTNTQTDRQTD